MSRGDTTEPCISLYHRVDFAITPLPSTLSYPFSILPPSPPFLLFKLSNFCEGDKVLGWFLPLGNLFVKNLPSSASWCIPVVKNIFFVS